MSELKNEIMFIISTTPLSCEALNYQNEKLLEIADRYQAKLDAAKAELKNQTKLIEYLKELLRMFTT
jgi:prephenate dehydrogenase